MDQRTVSCDLCPSPCCPAGDKCLFGLVLATLWWQLGGDYGAANAFNIAGILNFWVTMPAFGCARWCGPLRAHITCGRLLTEPRGDGAEDSDRLRYKNAIAFWTWVLASVCRIGGCDLRANRPTHDVLAAGAVTLSQGAIQAEYYRHVIEPVSSWKVSENDTIQVIAEHDQNFNEVSFKHM